ncbi:Alcohol dehydrogenase transcription factor myb/sant-like protein [Caenorhabditis elegans]|uniref:Alcohol dehydrogenase transcription factor myb/sant-like protein n=1 Tax=Caenorhabditis elegans TaxID=6239 RepID=O17149_CAEEL|nr:Alcohol dehydrogenase transcription factor myb/sant-like protein [Caenorhabditis elegans]CCD61999.1 Alcohol dehydrogenase transcription factor myb/sant-like protein [Caenorhabditis elegans]|eukprot:NP_494420.1 LIn-8 Domain containing [Caenorhabditis elegans]
MLNIKQEGVVADAPRALTPIPPFIHHVSMEEYMGMELNSVYEEATKDSALKKVVLDLLKDRKAMWAPAAKPSEDKWQKLGAEVFSRTGKVVSVTQLRRMLVSSKHVLKTKMSHCIKVKKMDRVSTEAYLQNWEFYRHFRYYRETLGQFEANLRGEQWTGEDQPADDDDDIIYDGIFEVEMVDRTREAQPAENQGNQEEYHVEEVPYAQEEQVYENQQQNQQTYPMHGGSPSSDYSTISAHSLKRRRSTTVDSTAEQIGEEIDRLIQLYPQREMLIRQAFFKTIFALEDETVEFSNLGDLFEDLAEQENFKRRRRSRAQRLE